MKKAVLQFMACCMAVGIAFTGPATVALADYSISLAGISSVTGSMAMEGAEPAADTAETDAPTETEVETEAPSAADEAPVTQETEPVVDTSMSGELAFAQCDVYINVRDDASLDGEVVGKVYNNGSVTILGQVGDWYQVQSGNVTGYVKAEYFATGEAADAIAEEVAYNVATVYPEALMIRSEPSEESDSIGMAYSSDQLEVVAYEGDWMKVALGNDVYGYVSAYYVSYDTYYATAETLEEEQQRLDEQWLAYLAEQKAEQEAAEQAYLASIAAESSASEPVYSEPVYEDTSYTDTSYSDTSYSDTSYAASSSTTSVNEAQATADALYQEYLNAQAAADAATQQADEQLVYDTYNAAVAAYQKYLSAQAVVDNLVASNQAAYTTTYETEPTYYETEAATYETEPVYYETEAPVYETEPTYYETEAPAPSYSSLGESIASYAVQFVGNPYVYGGTSLTNGADCSGFTQSVFANFGISIPRTAASQAGSGTEVSLSNIQAGDLLFYSDGGGISHVALYIGGGQVVHASTSSTGIIISNYNYRTPVCARRYC